MPVEALRMSPKTMHENEVVAMKVPFYIDCESTNKGRDSARRDRESAKRSRGSANKSRESVKKRRREIALEEAVFYVFEAAKVMERPQESL